MAWEGRGRGVIAAREGRQHGAGAASPRSLRGVGGASQRRGIGALSLSTHSVCDFFWLVVSPSTVSRKFGGTLLVCLTLSG